MRDAFKTPAYGQGTAPDEHQWMPAEELRCKAVRLRKLSFLYAQITFLYVWMKEPAFGLYSLATWGK